MFRLGGREIALRAGQWIGRSPEATLSLNDPRISEFHAAVSWRAGGLCMLGLRRRLDIVDGVRSVDQVVLTEGLQVRLCPDVVLTVVTVVLPTSVVVLRGLPDGDRVLDSSDYTLYDADPPRVLDGCVPDGHALLWQRLGAWWWLRPGGRPEELVFGAPFALGTWSLQLMQQDRPTPIRATTAVAEAAAPAMELILSPTVATIRRPGLPDVQFGGRQAELLHEVRRQSSDGEAVQWEPVATRVFGVGHGPPDWKRLRSRYHRTIEDLNERLRRLGLAELLVLDAGLVRFRGFPGDLVRLKGDADG